jgi:hypothetical protein
VTKAIDPGVQSELASIGMHIATAPDNVQASLDLVTETWNERAAIRQYLGGMPRAQAELLALKDTCEVLGVKTK